MAPLYGCHNRTLKGGYYAPSRKFFPDGSFEASSKFIKYRMSLDCKFDRRAEDPRCAGCKHIPEPAK